MSFFSLSLELTSAPKTFSYSSLNLPIAGSFSSSAMICVWGSGDVWRGVRSGRGDGTGRTRRRCPKREMH
jgi:hypothetical protein